MTKVVSSKTGAQIFFIEDTGLPFFLAFDA